MSEKWTPGNWTVESRMHLGDGWSISSDHDFPTREGKTFGDYPVDKPRLDNTERL